MPTYTVTAPNGKTLDISGDRVPSESELKDIFAKAGVDAIAAPSATVGSKPSDAAAIPMAASGGIVPALETLATSPTAAKTMGTVARAGTTVAGLVHGVATGNVPEIIASPIAGWQAGKGGYFLGKGMQSVAAPLAEAAAKVAPYVKAASGAQGILDLAQMAEPNRKDLGFLGISTDGTHDPNHPALLNLLAMKAADGIGYLIKQGLSLGEASRTYWNLKAKTAK